jgi:hypothetical protein
MATWMTHLRVAEKIKDFLDIPDEAAFYVGSVAPDSGQMINNFTYVPSKDVSHWKREGVTYEQRFEDNADFFRKYCERDCSPLEKSLFLGYYVHILTDTIYVRDIIHPFMNAHGKDFWKANITAIRDGWYQIDFRFLKNNCGFRPLRMLGEVKEFKNEFFDYFTEDDITERINFAVELYANGKADESVPLLTHNESDAEKMVGYMTETILKILKEKHNI